MLEISDKDVPKVVETLAKRISDEFMPIALVTERDENIAQRNTAAVNRNASSGKIRRKRAMGCGTQFGAGP